MAWLDVFWLGCMVLLLLPLLTVGLPAFQDWVWCVCVEDKVWFAIYLSQLSIFHGRQPATRIPPAQRIVLRKNGDVLFNIQIFLIRQFYDWKVTPRHRVQSLSCDVDGVIVLWGGGESSHFLLPILLTSHRPGSNYKQNRACKCCRGGYFLLLKLTIL